MVNKDLGRIEQVSVGLLRKLENQAMDLQLPDLTVQDSTFSNNQSSPYLPIALFDVTMKSLCRDAMGLFV